MQAAMRDVGVGAKGEVFWFENKPARSCRKNAFFGVFLLLLLTVDIEDLSVVFFSVCLFSRRFAHINSIVFSFVSLFFQEEPQPSFFFSHSSHGTSYIWALRSSAVWGLMRDEGGRRRTVSSLSFVSSPPSLSSKAGNQLQSGRRSSPLFPLPLPPLDPFAGSPRPGDSGGRPLFQARVGRRRRYR